MLEIFILGNFLSIYIVFILKVKVNNHKGESIQVLIKKLSVNSYLTSSNMDGRYSKYFLYAYRFNLGFIFLMVCFLFD